MFRKPKKNLKKAGIRRRSENDDEEEGNEDSTLETLSQARKRPKPSTKALATGNASSSSPNDASSSLMHHFEASEKGPLSQKELATRTDEHHPTKVIDRGNKWLAGPIKAPTNIRTTSRFDYQPDICKDYKETGFCGFGDGCIYLHDRGDTLSGWQIEQQWQQQQEEKKKKQQEQIDEFLAKSSGNAKKKEDDNILTDDNLPFACHICRKAFTEPVVTTCGHYFCQPCILEHVKESSQLCPVCNKDTHGVFNQPTKLLSKKRKLCGRDSTWQEFQESCRKENTAAAD